MEDTKQEIKHINQEIKLEPKEESSFGELMDCEESKETCLLKIEENVLNDPMKTENIIKTDGGPFIPVPLKTDVSDAEGTIETKDSLKVKLLENDFKTEIIKSEDCIKTLVIKLERIDDKFCMDGLKLCKEENCSNSDSKDIIYKSPMKTPDVFLVSNADNGADEESDLDNNPGESNLNLGVRDQESLPGSTSAKVKRSYRRPSKFVCTTCDKGYTSAYALRVHTRIHTGERPFHCSYCDKTFRTKTVLAMHLKCHSRQRYECKECNTRFTEVGSLKSHLQTHSGDHPFQCTKCRRVFTSKTTLIKHFKTKCCSSQMVVDDVECFTCAICKINFERKTFLYDHIQIVHLKKKSFPCKICGMKSFTEANLKKHERLHENKYSFVCQECNMSFKEKGGLTSHMQSAHSEIKPFSCDQCSSSFKSLSNLKYHNEVHHTNKNPTSYVCDVCNMGFYHRKYLKRHQMSHTDLDKTLSCDVCDIKCRSKTDMERHVVTHIGGGDKPFKCNLCTMAFSRRGKMLRHQLVHSNEKPYQCDLCTKAYKDSGSLRIHKDSFHLKKKFVCDRCGFKSTNESSFKRHVRNEMCKI